MKSISIRTIAAGLAAIVTLCGLKGIAELARTDRYAAMPVVVLPAVTIVATKPGDEPLIAGTAPIRKLR